MIDRKFVFKILPIIILILLLFVAFNHSLRTIAAQLMDTVLGRLIDPLNIPFFMILVIIAAYSALATTLIQKYMIDYVHVNQNQDEIKKFQKRYLEVMRSKDDQLLKEMEKKNKELTRQQLELSLHQLRPLGYILLIILPCFCWIFYRINSMNPYISMPIFGNIHLAEGIIGPIPAWLIWYIICSFSFSIIIRASLDMD